MKHSLQILFTSAFFLFLHPCRAQDYTVHVQLFGIEDGLGHRDVSTLFRDSHGFLWVATNKKTLQRFDGHEFKSYPIPELGEEAFSVAYILEDGRGWLLMVTGHPRTTFLLHPLTGEIQTTAEYFGENKAGQLDGIFRETTNYNLLPSDRGNGRLYFGKENRIDIFDFGDGATTLDLPHFDLVHIHLVDSEGNIWVTPNEGDGQLTKLSPSGEVMASYKKPGPAHASYSNLQVYEWEGHIYYFASHDAQYTGQELYRIGPAGQKENVFSAPEGYQGVTMMDGRVWCLGPVGWKVFGLSGRPAFELRRTDYDKKLFEGLSNINIVSDGKGQYYLPTEFGFNIIEVRRNPFTEYFSSTGKRQLPIKNSARGIYADGDSITVNFEFGGLVRIGRDSPDSYRIAATSVYSPFAERRKGYDGRPLLEASDGSFWTGHSNSVQNWSATLAEKTHIPLPPANRHYGEGNWALWEDGAGCIWASFHRGMMVYCPGDQTTYFHKNSEMGVESPELFTYKLMPERPELLWLCSEKGLFAFDPIERKVRHRYHKKGDGVYALPGNIIYDMHIDDAGNKWLGTEAGLVFWDIKTGEKRTYNRNDGLSNETIYAVIEDEHNRLWLSSDYGIMSFHKETHKVQTYLPKDGVAQKEFNRLSHFKSEDGTIYFGGLNGLTAFHPDDFLLEENEHANLVLTGYELFDGDEGKLMDRTAELINTNTIVFCPADRYFKLKFTLPTYDEVDKNLYAWKIAGIFDEWNYQKENNLQLASLPYGKHVLEIKGQGARGGWSPYGLEINVQVTRPFYLQYWFLGLCLLTLALGLWAYNRYRVLRFKSRERALQKKVNSATEQINQDKKLIEGQADELRKLDKVKSRFFANVSHELRTPLTLILGPIGSVLKNNKLTNRDFTHLLKAQQSGKDLLKLVASILDLSKMESGKLELHESPEVLFNLVHRIASAFESHAQREGIGFEFEYLANKDLQLRLDREKLETILNNLLSNAVKFTPSGGNISIKTEDLGHALRISVADTGRGIHSADLPHVFDRFYQSAQAGAPAEGGTGIGLALSRELAKMMGGRIWVESPATGAGGEGSTFFVEIPRVEVLGSIEAMPLLVDGGQKGVASMLEPRTVEATPSPLYPRTKASPRPSSSSRTTTASGTTSSPSFHHTTMSLPPKTEKQALTAYCKLLTAN